MSPSDFSKRFLKVAGWNILRAASVRSLMENRLKNGRCEIQEDFKSILRHQNGANPA